MSERTEAATIWWHIKPGWAIYHPHWENISDHEKRLWDGIHLIKRRSKNHLSCYSQLISKYNSVNMVHHQKIKGNPYLSNHKKGHSQLPLFLLNSSKRYNNTCQEWLVTLSHFFFLASYTFIMTMNIGQKVWHMNQCQKLLSITSGKWKRIMPIMKELSIHLTQFPRHIPQSKQFMFYLQWDFNT